MPRLKQRNRVISVRLSDEEYEQLKRLCSSQESDNISVFARRAMKRLLAQGNAVGQGDMDAVLDEIHSRLSALDRDVARLCAAAGLSRAVPAAPLAGK